MGNEEKMGCKEGWLLAGGNEFPITSLIEFLIVIPFFFGLFFGFQWWLHPHIRPNFDRMLVKRVGRRQYDNINPENYTRAMGKICLGMTVIYFFLVLLPFLKTVFG